MRLDLARKAFARTARYDGLIATELERLSASGEGGQHSRAARAAEAIADCAYEREHLRYGENPHQAAALYVPAGSALRDWRAAKQLQGKELSYNNLVDLDAAWALANEFDRPAVAIIKHNNPCGVAEQESFWKRT